MPEGSCFIEPEVSLTVQIITCSGLYFIPTHEDIYGPRDCRGAFRFTSQPRLFVYLRAGFRRRFPFEIFVACLSELPLFPDFSFSWLGFGSLVLLKNGLFGLEGCWVMIIGEHSKLYRITLLAVKLCDNYLRFKVQNRNITFFRLQFMLWRWK